MYYRVWRWPPDNFCQSYSTIRDLGSGTLSVTVRFHLKCHLDISSRTAIGDFGCRLCEKNGIRTILRNPDGKALPDHLSSSHSIEELEADPDLVVVRHSAQELDADPAVRHSAQELEADPVVRHSAQELEADLELGVVRRSTNRDGQ
jgi:hypothetical protein